ncbi:MAG: nucleotide exchange factor GrpE [Deltaproteobacteria bacterium]|nr:nucleotide exchange factor GrpE [Deltaproteobacteria bacterium]
MSDPFKNKVEDLKKALQKKKLQEQTQQEPSVETPPELVELQNKLQTAEEEAKQNYDKLLRAVAEFDNYKKRVARDHEERVKYNLENVLKELLPVMDDFDRLMDHLPASESPEIQGLTEGVKLLHRHFMTAMKKFHLEEVKTEDEKFDPHAHEALNQVESDEHEDGDIVTCHRKGYHLHERLLRPALVTVAKRKENV